MKQPKRHVVRQLPRNNFAKSSLIGALEALEEHARWLVHYHTELWELDGLRNVLRTIDILEQAGRWSDHGWNDDSEKRETAMALHPSGKNRDLTSPLESQTTHPSAATQPPEFTEGQGVSR